MVAQFPGRATLTTEGLPLNPLCIEDPKRQQAAAFHRIQRVSPLWRSGYLAGDGPVSGPIAV
jgi:hypothetical protein